MRRWNLKTLAYGGETVHLVLSQYIKKGSSSCYFTVNKIKSICVYYLCLNFCSGFSDIHMENSIMAPVTLHSGCMWRSLRSQVSGTRWHRAIGDSYRSTGPVMSSVSEQTGLSDIVYSSLPASRHLIALGVQSTKGFCPMFNHSSPSRHKTLGTERKRREWKGWVKESVDRQRHTTGTM